MVGCYAGERRMIVNRGAEAALAICQPRGRSGPRDLWVYAHVWMGGRRLEAGSTKDKNGKYVPGYTDQPSCQRILPQHARSGSSRVSRVRHAGESWQVMDRDWSGRTDSLGQFVPAAYEGFNPQAPARTENGFRKRMLQTLARRVLLFNYEPGRLPG